MKLISPIDISPGTPLDERTALSLDFLAESYSLTPDAADDATIVISTNIPEDDYSAWAAGTYTTGQRVLFEHYVYQVVADPSTTDQPDVGAAKDTPTWVRVSASNRWKMFDQIISASATNPGIISVSIYPGTIVNALALFGLFGSEVTLTMTDVTEGVVYSNTLPLQDNTSITDWYHYFFDEIVQIEDVVFLDLPSYGNAIIDVTIVAGSEVAECGELVIGRQREIGTADFGTGVGIQSYSVKTEDQFGGVTITPRAFRKTADYDISIDTPQVGGIQKLLASIRDTPIVYIGDPNRPETIVYGYYRNFNIVLADHSTSQCSLEVEGLV